MLRSLCSMRLICAVAVIAAVGMVDAAAGKSGEVKLESRLTASPADALASGKAKFEMRDDRVRFSAEVGDVASASSVIVMVNGTVVGQAAVALGAADLNLDSRDGDAVPVMASGDTVVIRNADTGVMILSGTL